MARFAYTAERVGGEVYKGVAEAPDRFELYQVVRREGGKIVAFTEESGGGVFSMAYWNEKLGRVKEHDKILLARNLGAMLSAGLSLARALSVLERQTKNPKLGSVIEGISADVRRGNSFHDALQKFPQVFPRLFISMVRAGEEGGDLPGALTVVADQLERMYTLKKKIRGAMIYPGIILIAIFGIGALMMIYVVPTLAATFRDMHAALPASTQIVIGISDFFVNYTLFAFGGVFATFFALIMAMKTDLGRRARDYALLHTPFIGAMVREVNAARTARTLSSLLSSGVDVLGALEISSDVVQNSFFSAVIKDAIRAVGAGQPLSATFVKREDLYPPFVGEMLSVGEETGALPEMLKRVALFYEEEIDRKTKDMSTIIEPVLMLLIGTTVGFFAVSMIAPIYSLTQNIH